MGIKILLALTCASGMAAVILGAFGAHGLKGKLSDSLMSAFNTGVEYHFYHTLALLAVAMMIQFWMSKTFLWVSAYLFLAGILFFSGSLYGLALGAPRWFGPITPLGGLLFILAWGNLAIGFLRSEM